MPPKVQVRTTPTGAPRKAPVGAAGAGGNNSISSGSKKDDVEKLLSDLDSLGAHSAAASDSRASSEHARTSIDSGKEKLSDGGAGAGGEATGTGTGQPPDAQSLLDDLDSLVQRRPLSRAAASKPGTPSKAGSSLSRTTSSTGISHSTKEDAAGTLGAEARNSSLATGSTSAPADASAGLDPEAGAAGAAAAASASRTGWGSSWGSVWNQATKLAEGARSELEKRAQSEQAKELQTKGWGFAANVRGLLQETGLEKIGADLTQAGKKGWTDIVNAVAPPIQAHEVIQVNLSHDMIGYDGVSDVVFRTLARVMEQQAADSAIEQQLVVNKPISAATPATPSAGAKPTRTSVDESGSASGVGASDERDLNAVEGFEEGTKLAEVELEQMIKAANIAVMRTPGQKAKEKEKAREEAGQNGAAATGGDSSSEKKQSVTLPITTCPVFLRIQPCLAPLPWRPSSANGKMGKETEENRLYFLLLLKDPTNGLTHQTISQAVPSAWLDVRFEENAWVEQILVDVLEVALGVIGQDYIFGRMSGRSSVG